MDLPFERSCFKKATLRVILREFSNWNCWKLPVKPAADKHFALKKAFSEPFGLQILQGNYQVQLTFFPQMYLNVFFVMFAAFVFLCLGLHVCMKGLRVWMRLYLKEPLL